MLLLGPTCTDPIIFVLLKKKGVSTHYTCHTFGQPARKTSCAWPHGCYLFSLFLYCSPDQGTLATAWLSVMVKQGAACLYNIIYMYGLNCTLTAVMLEYNVPRRIVLEHQRVLLPALHYSPYFYPSYSWQVKVGGPSYSHV